MQNNFLKTQASWLEAVDEGEERIEIALTSLLHEMMAEGLIL